MNKINEKEIIGFWGYPEPNVIEEYKIKFPNAYWLDLDINYGVEEKNILPESYCRIIKNIINNALKYKDKLVAILAPIGKDKCDSGWFASKILTDMGFNVITTFFEHFDLRKEVKISTSDLPLRRKFELITDSIITPQELELKTIKAKFGFWGVPPNDLSILELFPNETHVYGWTRCVEAKVPSDLDYELFVEPDVPTVFYAQSFCAKAQLAKYLADKYNGLYIDIDDVATNSTKAKIEAFLRLR